MASRDIANMHLFLEMKKKFPDLAEDTIRNYVFHCANDKDKCTELLLKESKAHFHSVPQFAEPRLSDTSLPEIEHNRSPKTPENQVHMANSGIPHASESINISATFPRQAEYSQNPPFHQVPFDVGEQNRTHSSVVWSQSKSGENLSVPKKSAQSAPVMATHERPFTDMYRYAPVSSHGEFYSSLTSDHAVDNRMMFSTTKEHIIESPSSGNVDFTPFPASPYTTESKRQSVQLSITPAFPLQQPQYVYNSSMSAAASHSSKPGRHMTSLNFQIQPSSADQYPLEISTIPEGIGQPCNFREFGSHVQVSVGPQGSTFTAFRVQRPQNQTETQYSTKSLSPQLPASSKLTESSQVPNMKIHGFPAGHRPRSSLAEISEVQSNPGFFAKDIFSPEIVFSRPQADFSSIYGNVRTNKNTQVGTTHGYQQSPAYKQDVIYHQKAMLDLLHQELENEKRNCSKLKADVNKMEQDFSLRSSKTSFPYIAELQNYREENRKLQIECNSLFTQVDSANMAVPLWSSDQDFYTNIFTGPSGAITSKKERHSPRLKKQSSSSYTKEVPDEHKEDDDDERNRWPCKKCTFFNHPALEKCEICDIPKSHGSYFDDE